MILEFLLSVVILVGVGVAVYIFIREFLFKKRPPNDKDDHSNTPPPPAVLSAIDNLLRAKAGDLGKKVADNLNR